MKTSTRLFLLTLFVTTFVVSGCGLLSTYSGYDSKDALYCQYMDGYWGEWSRIIAYTPQYIGSPNDFGIGFVTISPRIYYAKVKVNGFSKKDLKKDGSFTNYTGTIEYTIHDEDLSHIHNIPIQSRAFVEYFGNIKMKDTITRPATISICKGKRRGSVVYNIFFDNVGIAFDIPWN